jgi:hypothetical protein
MVKRHYLDKRAETLVANAPSGDSDLFNTTQLAAWLGVSNQFLEIGRSNTPTGRYGPAFIRIGAAVRYRKADVERWLKSRTCKPGESPIPRARQAA